MISAIGSKGECENALCVSPLGLPHRRISRVSLRVCGQRLIEEDVELSFEVPRTVSMHLGVRVVASGLATLRRCVLFSSCWVRYSMGCTRVRGARRGRGVRRSVLKQSVPWFTVHRWSSWPGDMRKHMESVEYRTVAEGNGKLFNCIEDYLTPRDAEESILPLQVDTVALRMRSLRLPRSWNSRSG